MSALQPRPLLCERTCGWISLDLDGELSGFERALMKAHLGRCADCAAFAAEAAATTVLLRAAELEPVPQPVSPPIRRRAGAGALRLGSAAAVALGALGLAGSLSDSSGVDTLSFPQHTSALPADAQVDMELKRLRLESLRLAHLDSKSKKLLLESGL